jgi:hypothetical protein
MKITTGDMPPIPASFLIICRKYTSLSSLENVAGNSTLNIEVV